MQTIQSNLPRTAIVGFGEAGQAFLSGWALGDPAAVTVFDVKIEEPGQRPALERDLAAGGVTGAPTMAVAVAAAEAVFSLVTADRALEAATLAAASLGRGALWFDCNSCAPDTKRRAARVIEAAGARYVDVAVMAPVHPRRHLVPLLVSGPHAVAGAAVLRDFGMRPRVVDGDVGTASSIKMLRSVMIKGMEALTAECFLAARRAGVEAEVLASLEASDGDVNWRRRASYNLERMMVHGGRRAAEMREVALTVAGLGLPSPMSEAAALWQAAVAATGAEPGADDLLARADAVLARIGSA
jgi:3-hydroxyisobutyrate dehydrogenase-like beta-hydroxyacid dehydrogenase